MVLYLIAIAIAIYSLSDFKKGFIYYIAFQIFWYPNAELINVRGLPVITLNFFMNFYFSALYLIYRKKFYKETANPYAVPLFLTAISYFVTCFFAVAGFAAEVPRAVILILQDVVIINIAWNVLETKNDFKVLFKISTCIFLIAEIYGLMEYVLKKNFFLLYKSGLARDPIALYDPNGFRGYRLVSVFEHPIGAALTFAIYCVWVICLYVDSKGGIKVDKISIATALLAVPCIILTKMRSGIVFLVIALLSIFKPKKKKFYYLVLLACTGLLILSPLLSQYSNLIVSLFDKEAQKDIGGSSALGRMGQLNAVLHLFQLSPIGGLGEKFSEYIHNQDMIDALGFESVWFIQLVRHGSLGVIATGTLLIYSVIVIPLKYKSRELFFICLSFWFVFSLSSIPSFRMTLYYVIVFYFIKQTDIYKKKKIRKCFIS